MKKNLKNNKRLIIIVGAIIATALVSGLAYFVIRSIRHSMPEPMSEYTEFGHTVWCDKTGDSGFLSDTLVIAFHYSTTDESRRQEIIKGIGEKHAPLFIDEIQYVPKIYAFSDSVIYHVRPNTRFNSCDEMTQFTKQLENQYEEIRWAEYDMFFTNALNLPSQ